MAVEFLFHEENYADWSFLDSSIWRSTLILSFASCYIMWGTYFADSYVLPFSIGPFNQVLFLSILSSETDARTTLPVITFTPTTRLPSF